MTVASSPWNPPAEGAAPAHRDQQGWAAVFAGLLALAAGGLAAKGAEESAVAADSPQAAQAAPAEQPAGPPQWFLLLLGAAAPAGDESTPVDSTAASSVAPPAGNKEGGADAPAVPAAAVGSETAEASPTGDSAQSQVVLPLSPKGTGQSEADPAETVDDSAWQAAAEGEVARPTNILAATDDRTGPPAEAQPQEVAASADDESATETVSGGKTQEDRPDSSSRSAAPVRQARAQAEGPVENSFPRTGADGTRPVADAVGPETDRGKGREKPVRPDAPAPKDHAPVQVLPPTDSAPSEGLAPAPAVPETASRLSTSTNETSQFESQRPVPQEQAPDPGARANPAASLEAERPEPALGGFTPPQPVDAGDSRPEPTLVAWSAKLTKVEAEPAQSQFETPVPNPPTRFPQAVNGTEDTSELARKAPDPVAAPAPKPSTTTPILSAWKPPETSPEADSPSVAPQPGAESPNFPTQAPVLRAKPDEPSPRSHDLPAAAPTPDEPAEALAPPKPFVRQTEPEPHLRDRSASDASDEVRAAPPDAKVAAVQTKGGGDGATSGRREGSSDAPPEKAAPAAAPHAGPAERPVPAPAASPEPTPSRPLAGSPAAEPKPAAPAEPSTQVVASEVRRTGDATQLRVLVEDDRLGSLALRLAERGGGVEVMLRAENPAAARQLQQGLPALYDSLLQRGFQTDARSWTPSSGSDGGRQQQHQQQDQERERQARQGARERRARQGAAFVAPVS
ncbi:MAG: hypothetical protein GC160_28750 [Acidobacteria bacterium]|nr:hypothetical protein [Acidobacteriota bacterium]